MTTTTKAIVSVKVADKNSQVVKQYQLEAEGYEEIKALHEEATRVWSECWVTFQWNGGECFIYGYPYEMALDEERVDSGEITFEQYTKKWFN